MVKKIKDFFIATGKEIKNGDTTDIYFIRTVEILRKMGKIDTEVSMEITSGKLPHGCHRRTEVDHAIGKLTQLTEALFPKTHPESVEGVR